MIYGNATDSIWLQISAQCHDIVTNTAKNVSDRSRQRFAGYKDAMANAGLVCRAPLELPFNTTDTHRELLALLQGKHGATALLCSNDQLAMAVRHDRHVLRLLVPEDFSVASFDGAQVRKWMTPVLTAKVNLTADIGRMAVDHLLEIIADERNSIPALLPHTLREGSTAQRHVFQVSLSNLKRKLQ
jgi:DNA-binding LacI/PurR family transcriptional regulator